MRKLEEEYDIILFNRCKKQVTLTGAGQRLLEITRRLFEVEKQAHEMLSESRALRSGSLRVIADSAHHALPILGRFRERYPNIELSIRSGNSEKVITQLYNYEAEVGILGQVPQSRDFETIKLSSAPLIAFTATGHPLSRHKSMTLAMLSQQMLVLRERGSKTRQNIEAAAAARGIKLKAAIEAEGREAVREIVATSGGVGVVSAAEFGQDSRLVPIRLSDCEIMLDQALICLRERRRGQADRRLPGERQRGGGSGGGVRRARSRGADDPRQGAVTAYPAFATLTPAPCASMTLLRSLTQA